jgi:hypothetical protein
MKYNNEEYYPEQYIFQSVTITFHHISLQRLFNIISLSYLSLVCLCVNVVLLGTSLLCTKLILAGQLDTQYNNDINVVLSR